TSGWEGFAGSLSEAGTQTLIHDLQDAVLATALAAAICSANPICGGVLAGIAAVLAIYEQWAQNDDHGNGVYFCRVWLTTIPVVGSNPVPSGFTTW
ncbi:MAG TPA: hypothetical protein VEE83_03205, partial [Thermoplasmata archaeon]|nr:hypothetical protein [Thermoplasmata archaeon]